MPGYHRRLDTTSMWFVAQAMLARRNAQPARGCPPANSVHAVSASW